MGINEIPFNIKRNIKRVLKKIKLKIPSIKCGEKQIFVYCFWEYIMCRLHIKPLNTTYILVCFCFVWLFFVFSFLLFSQDKDSTCTIDSPSSHYVDQAGLELTDIYQLLSSKFWD